MLTLPPFHRGYHQLGLTPPSHVLSAAGGSSGAGDDASVRPVGRASRGRRAQRAGLAKPPVRGKRKRPEDDPAAPKRSRLLAKDARGRAAAASSAPSSSSDGSSAAEDEDEEREEEEEEEGEDEGEEGEEEGEEEEQGGDGDGEAVTRCSAAEVAGVDPARALEGALTGKAGRAAPVQVGDAMSSPDRGDLPSPPPTTASAARPVGPAPALPVGSSRPGARPTPVASLAGSLGGDDLLGRTELLPLFEEAVDRMGPELSLDSFGEGADLDDVLRSVEGSCSKVLPRLILGYAGNRVYLICSVRLFRRPSSLIAWHSEASALFWRRCGRPTSGSPFLRPARESWRASLPQ